MLWYRTVLYGTTNMIVYRSLSVQETVRYSTVLVPLSYRVNTVNFCFYFTMYDTVQLYGIRDRRLLLKILTLIMYGTVAGTVAYSCMYVRTGTVRRSRRDPLFDLRTYFLY